MIYLCPSDGEAHNGKDISQDFISVAGEDASIEGFGGPPDGTEFVRLAGHSYIYLGYALDWNQADPALEGGTGTKLSNFSGFIAIISGFSAQHQNWVFWTDHAHQEDIDDVVCEDGTVSTVLRLREGIERFFITDINNPASSATAQSSLAIMWDTAQQTSPELATLLGDPGAAGLSPTEFNHVPGGANILYMDGHVEFVKFPSATEWVVSAKKLSVGAYS